MKTINDIIIALRERNRGNTHWEHCETTHVDCAAIFALTMFKEIVPLADVVIDADPKHRDAAIEQLAKKLNDAHALWLYTFRHTQD